MKRRFFRICLIICLLLIQLPQVKAVDFGYTIEEVHKDGTTSILAESSFYQDALYQYQYYEPQVDNLLIRGQDYIWKVKYGIVLFDTSEACDVNVEYRTYNGESGYTNGCYAIDAAYIGTADNQTDVSFLLSGVQGVASTANMDIQPIEASTKTSQYTVDDGKLYHQIKTQMQDDTFSSSVYLGSAPSELEDGKSYYSYDGHYFYPIQDGFEGFYAMMDDVRSNTHEQSVNASMPYYNYYQFLSHRSSTSYNQEDIDSYLEDTLHINKALTSYQSNGIANHSLFNQSMLYKQSTAFLQYQAQFSSNALMMMALAMNESATGRSYLSYTRNNLFGHAAYDSDVEANASRYTDVSSSIYSHAKNYINGTYSDPTQFQYHGGFFGNKASGMNVSYASDPYWGEKASQYYQRIDDVLGNKDQNQYTIAIASNQYSVKVYSEANFASTILYETNGWHDFAMLVLQEEGDWYKIQLDPTYQDNAYNPIENIGYVQKNDITHILQQVSEAVDSRIPITFDAGDGTFQDSNSSLTLYYNENSTPAILAPHQEGWLFTKWDNELTTVTAPKQYTAQYEKITSATVSKLPKQSFISDENLDVSGGILTIALENGDSIEVPLDISMVSGFNNEVIGTQTIQVNYQGASTSYTVDVTASDVSKSEELNNRIQTLLQTMDINDEFTSSQKEEIITLQQELQESKSPQIGIDTYRLLDKFVQKAYGNSLQIIINDDGLDASISGLSLASPINKGIFPSTLKTNIEKGVRHDAQEALENIAIGNGYTPEFTFNVSGSHGFKDLELTDDIIIAIKKPENTQLNNSYMVLSYENEDVRMIPTNQSSQYITFVTNKFGDYALISSPTSIIYTGNDIIENNTKLNSGTDYIQIVKWIAIPLLLSFIVLIIVLCNLRLRKRKKKHIKQKKRHSQPTDVPNSLLSSFNFQPDDEEDTRNDESK